MAYTVGQAAFDLAVLAGWTILGVIGGIYYWSTHSSQGIDSGCAPSGSMCE